METTKIRLERLMKEKNLRQIDIIKLCEPFCDKYNVKIGRSDLCQYLSGKYLPKQKKLTVLAKALNVSEAWLMGYDVPRNENQDQSVSDEIIALLAEMSEDKQKMLLDFIKGFSTK